MAAIPTVSNYPDSFDTDDNLFEVHDSLRLRLLEDYNPGDTRIVVEGDLAAIMPKFPSNGLITLTEQCSDIDDRAISFFYNSKTDDSFEGLELLPGFTDVVKPKRITNVTQNVMSRHHNHIKDAVIAIEEFIGVKGTTDTRPLGDTLEGRVNFLTKLILTPKAWFSVNKRIGLVPLTVTFTDESIRLGNCDVVFIWDFGDQSCASIVSGISGISGISCPSTICVTSVVPTDQVNVVVQDVDGGSLVKTYITPGTFDVELKVRNENGEDIVVFRELINARIAAPDEAIIELIPRSDQTATSGSPIGGPFDITPTIRSKTNTFINIEIPPGENPNTPGRSFAGELLDGSGTPIDPILDFTWELSDDLTHSKDQSETRASFGAGGIFDLVLRVDTSFGAYRITTYEDTFDIIEDKNLWLWTSNGTTVAAQEFGLISETFKTASTPLTITRNDTFLTGTDNETQAKREFSRNTGFAPKSETTSGDQGTTLLYWASGGAVIADQEILVREYNGFSDTYTTQPSIPSRPWNWVHLTSGRDSFFIFGQEPPPVGPNTNPSFQTKSTQNLGSLTVSNSEFSSSNFLNGALELIEHVSIFDDDGDPTNGFFAVYRSTWRSSTGFIVRNDGVGDFFRIRSFYQTEGTITNPFINISKLTDMAGTTKTEGQLVTLSNGVFFFNNSGSISAYNVDAGVWEVGTASSISATFNSLQDSTVSGFDNTSNTLLAASDDDRIVYLSFDYSTNAFTKFNGVDRTFSSAGSRPAGTQFMMGIY